MRKILSLVLAVAMVMSLASVAFAAETNGFIDVEADTWYTEAVAWAVENGITKGKGEANTFAPDETCTRAEIVTFLYRYAGEPSSTAENTFTDVAADVWYTDAVVWAVENGITKGKGEATTFVPDDTCTRAEIVTFLYRFAGEPSYTAENTFADVAADTWYTDAVVWAVENGVTKGYGEADTFCPDRTCSRAEAVTFLSRFDSIEIEAEPIVILNASELTSVKVEAGSETVYAITSRLSGMILTIAAKDGVTVTVNGVEIEAVNGLHSVELTGAPMNKVVVANAGDKAVELVAAIEPAAGTESNPIVINAASDLTSVEAEAGSETYYAISSQLNGYTLTVVAKEGLTVTVNGEKLEAVDGLYTAELTGVPTNKVVVANTGDKAVEVVASIDAPAGTVANPIVINAASDLTSVEAEAGSETYYAVSSQLNGNVLTVVAAEGVTVTVNGVEVEAVNGVYSVVLNGTPVNKVVVANAGDKAVQLVAAIEPAAGTESNPIVINATSDLTSVEAAAGSETYYAISSQLNGNVLTVVAAEGVTVSVNGEKAVAVDGVYSVVLNGTPVNKVVVANAGDKAVELVAAIEPAAGTENNPIVINAASELTSVEAAAGSETYYAISSQLNGNVLTVAVAEGVTVTVNGVEAEVIDGVYSAELTGEPVNKVVVANAGDKAVELDASIKAAPIVINNVSELTSVKVGAGDEAVYAISGRLSGNVLTIVAAEGVTVTVNGVEVEAVDGLYSVKLDGAPVNKVVVANAGDKAVELVAAIEPAAGTENNPIVVNNADDMGVINIAAASEIYYAVNSQLNGLYLHIEALEGIAVTVNGVEAVADEDGFYVVELAGAPVNKVVVANAGTEAAELIAYIQAAPGSESNPIFLQDNVYVAEIPAGETVYFAGRIGGKNVTIENAYGLTANYGEETYYAHPFLGTLTFSIPASESFPAPVEVFSVTNSNAEDGTYYITLAETVYGTMENPETLVIGENTATLEAGSWGYFYTWTAEEDGELTVAVDTTKSSDWTFVINNNTSYIYGDTHFSDDEVPVTSETITVSAGDEIQIVVGTASYGAGEVVLNVSFE